MPVTRGFHEGAHPMTQARKKYATRTPFPKWKSYFHKYILYCVLAKTLFAACERVHFCGQAQAERLTNAGCEAAMINVRIHNQMQVVLL